MIKISDDIKNLVDDDIEEFVLAYEYKIDHLLKIIKQGLAEDDERFLSTYRSFEGAVFENLVYERLIRYATTSSEIKRFLIKGLHKDGNFAKPNALSVNKKGQIVYRIKRNEIGEFDGLFFTNDSLFFIEMTLVKSIASLKKRLRKKHALLKTLFPTWNIKALLILNEGVMGASNVPDYVTVWKTKQFDASKYFKRLRDHIEPTIPFKRIYGKNLITASSLKVEKFDYFGTLVWIMEKLRDSKRYTLNAKFLHSKKFIQFHELYTKVYIGFIKKEDFLKLYEIDSEVKLADVFVISLEYEHTGELNLTYFSQLARKKLLNIRVKNGNISVVKKDPFGVSVNEVDHMLHFYEDQYTLSSSTLKALELYIDKTNKRADKPKVEL